MIVRGGMIGRRLGSSRTKIAWGTSQRQQHCVWEDARGYRLPLGCHTAPRRLDTNRLVERLGDDGEGDLDGVRVSSGESLGVSAERERVELLVVEHGGLEH